jgi:IPT/TIG domain
VIISNSPQSGPAGTRVTIVGDNLTGATKVTFYGQKTSASFTVVSPTEIVAIAPAAPPEEGRQPHGPISVTTPLGEARGWIDLHPEVFESAIPHFILEAPAVQEAELPAPAGSAEQAG